MPSRRLSIIPMRRYGRNITLHLAVLVLAVMPVACSGGGSVGSEEYLIRVENSVVTVADFRRAFEIAKSAYTHNEMQNSGVYQESLMRLLNQLTEELILMQRAKELHIGVSESEMETAIAEIKKDFPAGDFERALLEHAVSFHAWKQRLKIRLLVDKLIEQELSSQVTIGSEELTAYYENRNRREADTGPPDEKRIVTQLRRDKAETMYRSWIKDLEKRYTIQINEKEWKKIAGLS